jgi:DNA topoisomerase-1
MIPSHAKRAARAAGLIYVSDAAPGISRHGRPGQFRYRDPAGRWVQDRARLDRIRRLAIPPAWQGVWIAPRADAHLQATGRDARGRKQYRYHDGFAAVRDAVKYAHLAEFAAGLAALRRRLKRDLSRPPLSRDQVMAAVVTLLEETLIRIGNEDYAKANASFGLTTLRNRHVKVKGDELRFLFKGKSGKQWSLSVADRRVAKVVRSCQDLPGQHLFEYLDEQGVCRKISSSDVNAYLREATGRDITAKDFRTRAGTVMAAMALAKLKDAPGKKAVNTVIAAVSKILGNTASICRRCYVHPEVIAAFEAGKLTLHIPAAGSDGLAPEEVAVKNFLRGRARPAIIARAA